MKCPNCDTEMRQLFTSYYCPNNCDKTPAKKDTWTYIGNIYNIQENNGFFKIYISRFGYDIESHRIINKRFLTYHGIWLNSPSLNGIIETIQENKKYQLYEYHRDNRLNIIAPGLIWNEKTKRWVHIT